MMYREQGKRWWQHIELSGCKAIWRVGPLVLGKGSDAVISERIWHDLAEVIRWHSQSTSQQRIYYLLPLHHYNLFVLLPGLFPMSFHLIPYFFHFAMNRSASQHTSGVYILTVYRSRCCWIAQRRATTQFRQWCIYRETQPESAFSISLVTDSSHFRNRVCPSRKWTLRPATSGYISK